MNILVGWLDEPSVFFDVDVPIIIKIRVIVKNIKGSNLENMEGRSKNFTFNLIHCEHILVG